MADETLGRILEKLEDIEAILLLANNASIQEAKKDLLKEGSEQHKIYALCQGKTTKEIMSIVNKSEEYVNANLRRLRTKGLVRSVLRKEKYVHEQRF